MAEAGVAALFRDLVLEAFDHAFVERLDLMALAADQVMMVMMPVPRTDFMPGRPVDPGDPLHEFLFFENGNEPENGGEVAAFRAHLLVNLRQGEGNRAGIEQPDDGDASMGGAQAVLPQPRDRIDGVMVMRFRLCGHGYL